MELPLSSSRLDCMIFGRDRTGHASALLVELKQWSQAKPSEVEDCVLTFVGGAERDQLHPSIQAMTYAQYLADAHEGYDPDTGVMIRPSSFLHNMTPSDARYLRSSKFDDLMQNAPLFVGRDADRFAEAMHLAVGKGDGERVMQVALSDGEAVAKAPGAYGRNDLRRTTIYAAGRTADCLPDGDGRGSSGGPRKERPFRRCREGRPRYRKVGDRSQPHGDVIEAGVQCPARDGKQGVHADAMERSR